MVPKASINHFKNKSNMKRMKEGVGWKQREEEIYVSSTLHDQAKKKKEEDRGSWRRRDRGGKEKRKKGDDGCPIVDGRR